MEEEKLCRSGGQINQEKGIFLIIIASPTLALFTQLCKLALILSQNVILNVMICCRSLSRCGAKLIWICFLYFIILIGQWIVLIHNVLGEENTINSIVVIELE